MSRATSATTGRRYGLKRVCGTWERSRSALYARRARLQRPERGDGPARRGPTPALSDAQLLAAIRSDLARSPFQGEGHRKVHARLRILDRIRVSRTRVLRVMRTQGLLSPHRGRQRTTARLSPRRPTSCGAPTACGCSPRTTAGSGPSRRWTIGMPSWHVCKVGSRFAALEPLAQGLGRLYGSVEADYGWITAASICRTTFSTSSGTGASTPASASLKSRKPTGSSSAGIARSRASRLRPGLSKPRRGARGRRRVRRTLQPVLAPRKAGVSHATRSARAVRATPCRVAQTCVQETGCGTIG